MSKVLQYYLNWLKLAQPKRLEALIQAHRREAKREVYVDLLKAKRNMPNRRAHRAQMARRRKKGK